MMNPLYYLPSTSLEHLSVEVFGDDSTFPSNQYDSTFDTEFNSLFDFDYFPEISVAGVCESADLIESLNNPVEAYEFDKYPGVNLTSTRTCDIDQNLLVTNSLPVCDFDKNKKARSNKKQILLSESVGVGAPPRLTTPSRKIEIVCDLEEKYRPRYKSDYFAQNGITRKPRYVADRQGQHYITLKIPSGTAGRVRIDWLTIPDENGERYFMPYRFQASNYSAEIADCNPTFEDIVTDGAGIMRVYLVLIKAKQDALKSLQPLQPFQTRDALGESDKYKPQKVSKLTPKQLIQKYQLGKSQLAFTLCTMDKDCQSCIPEWGTTVFSTVLEEEGGDNSADKTVLCPNCSNKICVNDDGIVAPEKPTNKRKISETKADKPKTVKKQNRFPEQIYCVN